MKDLNIASTKLRAMWEGILSGVYKELVISNIRETVENARENAHLVNNASTLGLASDLLRNRWKWVDAR